MSTKPVRPPFQPIELDPDPIDARLEAKAAEKGIPTLVATPAPKLPPISEPEATYIKTALAEPSSVRAPAPPIPDRPMFRKAAPRKRVKDLKVALPEYVWVALRIQAAKEMTSIRFVIMDALRASGIPIEDEDMIQDGRRIR